MNQQLLQIIDANLNRAREGLRVCEDISRFVIIDRNLTGSLKNIRHILTRVILQSKRLSLKKILQMRNTRKDAMRNIDFKRKRADIIDIFMSNIERVKESLRVLEECCKVIDGEASYKFRRLRFNTYDIEKKAVEKIRDISCIGHGCFKRR